MGIEKLPRISDDGWPEAVVKWVLDAGNAAEAEYKARHGRPLGETARLALMDGAVLTAIHVLAKRVDEIHKAAAAGAKATNEAVDIITRELAEVQETGLRYRGYWRKGMHANRGDAYTENGGLWYCVRDTDDSPRAESPDWTIAARAGRDGRDLK